MNSKTLFIGFISTVVVAGLVTGLHHVRSDLRITQFPGQQSAKKEALQKASHFRPTQARFQKRKTIVFETDDTKIASPVPKNDDERIAWFFGSKGSGTYQDRFNAVDSLSNQLTFPQVQVLLSYLEERKIPKGLTESDWYSLKNEVMNRLRNQEVRPRELTSVLINLALDPKRDAGTRDYALQHLGLWYSKTLNVEERIRIEKTFWSLTKQPSSPFAGVALMSMFRLQQDLEVAEPDNNKQLLSTALALAGDSNALPETRTSSLAICAEVGSNDALPLSRKLALSEPTYPLRLAALHLLGKLGHAEDMDLLKNLSSSDPAPEIRKSATVALELLKQKLARA